MGNGNAKLDRTVVSLRDTARDHTAAINCMALNEDNSMLITGAEDNTARMWTTGTKKLECMGVLKGHTSYINSIATQDKFVFTGSGDSTIRKWDMTTCDELFVYRGHDLFVQRILVIGDFIFSSSYDATAKCWLTDTEDFDPDKGETGCVRTFKGHLKGIYSLIYIPEDKESVDVDENDEAHINPGDLLITGSLDGTARSWSIDTGNCIKIFKGHNGALTTMSTDSDGKILYTAGNDFTIRSWNINTGAAVNVMSEHSGPVICLTVVNRLMYTGSTDHTARCWVTEFGDCTQKYQGHKHSVSCVLFHRGVLFTGCGDSVVRAYDANSGSLLAMYDGHEGAITSIKVVGERLFSASNDTKLCMWDIKEHSEIAEKIKNAMDEQDVEDDKALSQRSLN